MPEKKKKTGGRKKGTPNKASTVTRAMVVDFLAGTYDDMIERSKNLDDAEFCKFWKDLLPYAVPKLQPAAPEAIEDRSSELENQLRDLYGEI